MKSILLFSLMSFINFLSFGQQTDSIKNFNIPLKEGKAFYELIDTSSGTKDELFIAAKSFISNYFKTNFSIIKFEDKDAGIIEAKGFFTYSYKIQLGFTDESRADFTFDINLKDKKLRIQLHDFLNNSIENPSLNPKPFATSYKATKDKGWNKRTQNQLDSFHAGALNMLTIIDAGIKSKLSSSNW